MASTLGDRLRARIRRDGPLRFDAWMEACLYDPEGGFYMRPDHPAGTAQGSHFATSPTLHPFFAQAVAAELHDAWVASGRPKAWHVAEFGAGTGDLARAAVPRLLAKGVPVAWTAIDVREGRKAPGVTWSSTPPGRFDAAVANEFLDALPFRLAEWRDGWHEVGIGLDGDDFAWRLLDGVGVPGAAGREGERRVLMPAVAPWARSLADAGAQLALVVDYGGAGPGRDARAYRGHDHADPLDEPGTVDLTADIDFTALAEDAGTVGFACDVETQEAFLLRHGILDALNTTDRSTMEGASSYLRLRQLLLPTGLGAAFKVARLTRRPDPS